MFQFRFSIGGIFLGLAFLGVQGNLRLQAQDAAPAVATIPESDGPGKTAFPENFKRENLVAWCIVPFDAKGRSPRERALMLRQLGIKRLAYDWRDEHIPSWDEELVELRAHGIELTAFWCSSSLHPVQDEKNRMIVEFLKRNDQKTQLWFMLPEGQLAKIEDPQVRLRAAVRAVGELAEWVAPLDCHVGLYNHGGWSGRPETLVAIMESLKSRKNVGVVYNLHHAHSDLSGFPGAFQRLKPYLLCLNLNGTTQEGPKILPLGSGKLDREILGWIRNAEYTGPIGILDHRPEMDARESLLQNLIGLEELLKPAP